MVKLITRYMSSDGTVWDTEEEATKFEEALLDKKKWEVVEDHINSNLSGARYGSSETQDVFDWLKDYSLFIYSELRKIIPKEQLKELDKE